MIATIMLGIYIFGIIAGSKEGSVISTVRQVWMHEIDARNMEEFPGETQ